MTGKDLIKMVLWPKGKTRFLFNLNETSSIFDIGCGNNSPFEVKRVLPKSNYTGIDIGDYNQTKPNLADTYIVTTPDRFTLDISKFINHFDAVISSHNIEHCDNRHGTFRAMLDTLKPGGDIYISFPCEKSVSFPKRHGTLNYFDDTTHKHDPPDFDEFRRILSESNFEIEFSSRSYKPFLLWIIGFIIEPYSSLRKRVLPPTWGYYGFESIIWAKKC